MAEQRVWVEQVADDILSRGPKPDHEPIICASGISPSGPVHLGNLREVMVAHAVAEELARRGRHVRHLHFWDDFDRFRRVPAAVPDSFEAYVGRPLSDVPDPTGTCHRSYAEHFIADFSAALAELRVECEHIRQSEAYRSGIYAEGVRTAVEADEVIRNVLARFQTRGAGDDDASRLPLRVYCPDCGTDFTEVRRGATNDEVTFECTRCTAAGSLSLNAPLPAKLVWKVDWPMRWAHYGVDFEPGGVDHSSPGSSFEVGTELVRDVFGSRAPHYVGYSFVGTEGRSKLSGSQGDVPTPALALRALEPAILRWQYLRRRPKNSFTISFGSEVLRLYDEWDGVRARAMAGRTTHADRLLVDMSLRTRAGNVTAAPAVPFRVLAAAADVTVGNREQMLRVVREHLGNGASLEDLEPRLSCAVQWALEFQPEDERTHPRSVPADPDELGVDVEGRAGIALLLEHLETHWDLDSLTTLVYGVPKRLAGLPIDAPPDEEMKRRQREFFALLYRALTHRDTGPRLPTLLLSLGKARVKELLAPFVAATEPTRLDR